MTSLISARFDRDLKLPPSTITLRDKNNATIAGTQALIPPQSNTGGYRTIGMYLGGPLDEALSPYRMSVHACPAAGGCTDIAITFHVDDTAPAPPVVTSPVNGEVNTQQQIVARGTAEQGATVVFFEHHAELARTVAHEDGSWIEQLPYPSEDGTLHTISVRAMDEAGNWSDPTVVTFRHDCVNRPPTIIEPLQNSSHGSTSITIVGTAKANVPVKVFEGATELGSTTSTSLERWSMTITVGEGTHVIVAYSYDTYETAGPSQARTFSVDLTGPAPPVILQPPPAAHVPAKQVTISGTAEPLASVRIREFGVARTTTPVSATGEWATSLTFDEGPHTITAETVDAADNSGPQASRSFTVDTIAPGAPLIQVPAQDAFVSSNSVFVSGTAEADTTVEVLEGQAVLGSVLADAGGNWSVVVTLPDAAHTIQARSTDRAGNVGPRSLPRSFVVDTIAPATPVIVKPFEGSTVTTNPVLVTGTGEQATTITVTESSLVLGTSVADAAGNWSVVITFANGPHTIVAHASDNAGNVSGSSAPRSFTVAVPIDVTPPSPPVIVDPAEGSLQPGNVTFSGTAEPRAVVRVFEASSPIGNATAGADGTWAFGASMATGVHAVKATATDQAGNVSSYSAIRTFTVDAERPLVAIDPASPIIFLTPLVPGEIFGTASDNTAVTRIDVEYRNRVLGTLVASGIAETCAGCPGSPITWRTAPNLLPGIYLVRVASVDIVGNRSTPATATIVVA